VPIPYARTLIALESAHYAEIQRTVELLFRLTNFGQPFIYVEDGNYNNRGELYLAHQWTGLEVDAAKAGEVLSNLRFIWGRPVHLQMRMKDDLWLLSCTEPGKELKREKITDETGRPAHEVP